MDRIRDTHSVLTSKLSDILRVHKAKLYLFGSCVVNSVVEPKSDVDCVLLTEKDLKQPPSVGDPSTSQSRSEQNFVLNLVAKTLMRYTETFSAIQEKPRARVPYVRCVMKNGQEIDISANRRNGVRNSLLLRNYLAQPFVSSNSTLSGSSNSFFRFMSLAIKVWGKRTGLIDPAQAYLTSYALNILLCYYMIQRSKMNFIDPQSITVPTQEPVLPKYSVFDLEEQRNELGFHMRDFLTFYNHEFDFSNDVVTLSRPSKTKKADLEWTSQDEEKMRGDGNAFFYRLCIEDPYEDRLNLGRFVTPLRYGMLRLALHQAQINGLGYMDLGRNGAKIIPQMEKAVKLDQDVPQPSTQNHSSETFATKFCGAPAQPTGDPTAPKSESKNSGHATHGNRINLYSTFSNPSNPQTKSSFPTPFAPQVTKFSPVTQS